MTAIHGRVVGVISAAVSIVLGSIRVVSAQAWVPQQGEGSVSLAAQQLNVKKHLAGTIAKDAGHINTGVLLADVTYGLTDKFAVDLAIPFVVTKYSGTSPHPNTTIDDGTYHNSFTDFRMSVRYNLTRKGAVITPYVGSVVPSHDYAYYGHAAFGEQLNELQVGTFVAKLFTSGVPGMFVSSRIAYGFVEKVQDLSHNRSMADLEAGYFVTPSFRAFGMINGQRTHGGVDFPITGTSGLPVELRPVHDVIQRVNYVNLGAGLAYSIDDSFDLFGSFVREVAGRNGHVLNRGITIGASWSFSRKSKADAVAGSAGIPSSAEYARMTAKREGSLGRCICQKSGT
ncbi:MAG TPA: hypothetical protein VL882_20865 [Vicinamibacterales bacterium]|jgi:hypothetical protein|nr:hypothetical protein [Vicinamibacterales bacterium]